MAKTIISVDIKKPPTDQPQPLHNRWHPDIPPVVTVKPARFSDFASAALRNEPAQLAAEARSLRPAERELRRVGADDVHVDHSGVDLVRHPLRLLFVRRHQIGAEPERRVVRDADGVLRVARAKDRRDRPEPPAADGDGADLQPGAAHA